MYKTIYLAGGCFWGMQEYFDSIDFIKSTTAGYANSKIENPSYEEVCNDMTDAAETLKIIYDKRFISLEEILLRYLKVIDPFSVNRQANDIGRQYRTGIYYEDSEDMKTAQNFINIIKKIYGKKSAIECTKLVNFYRAEDYHQNYLKKNPDGYCHINISLADEMLTDMDDFTLDDKDKNIKNLTKNQYEVTQENCTDPPFDNLYDKNFEKGIYTDVVSGEILFLSKDKFKCSCGWPAFSKPVFHDSVIYIQDHSYNMKRIEVRSSIADSHLGHVFNDGPEDLTTLRYCINSSALKFIPYDEMKGTAYEKYMFLFDF